MSVIVPSYNHARFLQRRMDSILGQSFQDLELILLDDASTDDSAGILRGFATDPRVSGMVVNDGNSGSPFAQWERGLGLATGELVWIAETDDWADETFLETLVGLFDEHADLVLAYCRSEPADAAGVPSGDHFWADAVDGRRWRTAYVSDARQEVVDYLSCRNTIPNASAVVFRRSAVAGMRTLTGTTFAGDWMFWIGLLKKGGRIAFVPETLNHFRTHPLSSRAAKSPDAERRRIVEYLLAIGLTGHPVRLSSLVLGGRHAWLVDKLEERGHGIPWWLLPEADVPAGSRVAVVLAAILRRAWRIVGRAR